MKILVGYIIDGRGGGIDKYLLNLLQVAEDEDVQLDFLTNHIDGELAKRLEKSGCGRFEVPRLTHPLAHYKAVRHLLDSGEYAAAYFNISEPLNMFGALAAHKSGVYTMVHSHNSASPGSSRLKRSVRTAINALCRPMLNASADKRLACSHVAADWLFGSKSRDCTVIYNAVDSERFSFNPKVRSEMRAELGLADEQIAVCQVGNLIQSQKNQSFMLDVILGMKAASDNAVLFLIGDGPDRGALEEKARQLNLGESVRFLGLRDDINRLLQAMDVFVMPSFHEGLPIAAIEAQFSGLPAVISDSVSSEALIADNAFTLPLDLGAVEWAKAVAEAAEPRRAAHISDAGIKNYSLANQRRQLVEEILKVTGDHK